MQVKSIDEILEHMSLRDRIGQMMCVSFRSWTDEEKSAENTVENAEKEVKEINITELNDELRGFLKEYHPGAAIFFSENFNDPEQTLRLTADISTLLQVKLDKDSSATDSRTWGDSNYRTVKIIPQSHKRLRIYLT